jgi:hypothetical protein
MGTVYVNYNILLLTPSININITIIIIIIILLLYYYYIIIILLLYYCAF